ncbi:toprim domain-containing protein, partial [Ideonella sp.]|uniref:toprim domain-containing protein n=1 Tax=Ideonella sp. TaxID=1929293 RepID=UPI003BB59C18
QLGFPNAVATLGTACTADHVHKLLRFTEQVVFSFDGDAAGRRAAGRALEAALPHATDTRSFRFLFLPAEHDPDSFVRAFGSEAFEARVRDAVPLSRQLLEHVSEGIDLGSAEGRSRMLALARPLWLALPEGALRLQLLGELARSGGLPADELARLWGQSAPRSRSSGAAPQSAAAEESADGTPAHALQPKRKGFFKRDRSDMPPPVQTRRPPPKRPEDRVLQMLFGEPRWWNDLPANEHSFLHELPEPHGRLIAWLERDLAEHGVRPWAVLREALSADAGIDDVSRDLADGDADPGATFEDFRRALDVLLERDLARQMKQLLAQAGQDPEALTRYKALDLLWREVKRRQAILPSAEP